MSNQREMEVWMGAFSALADVLGKPISDSQLRHMAALAMVLPESKTEGFLGFDYEEQIRMYSQYAVLGLHSSRWTRRLAAVLYLELAERIIANDAVESAGRIQQRG